MRFITRAITYDREFKQAMLTLDEQYAARVPLPISASGLSDGALEAFLTEALKTARTVSPFPRLILVKDESEGRALAALLSSEGEEACYFPARDFVFLNITASHDTERERLSVLCRLLSGESVTVVTTPFAALQRTLPPSVLTENSLTLRVGDEISPACLADRLLRMGFTPVALVESVGQFAHRGGIFDLYAAGESAPVRLEFFGDEIDRLAYFDPISQRVTEAAPTVSLVPARESLWDGEKRRELIAAHTKLLSRATGETYATLARELALHIGNPFANSLLHILGKLGRVKYLVKHIDLGKHNGRKVAQGIGAFLSLVKGIGESPQTVCERFEARLKS
jgi:transcription-repair coupling factor (superfamily II helicase)